MKAKLLELKRLIDDIRYDLVRTRTDVKDETWELLNKASKLSAELVISYEENAKKELDSDKKEVTI